MIPSRKSLERKPAVSWPTELTTTFYAEFENMLSLCFPFAIWVDAGTVWRLFAACFVAFMNIVEIWNERIKF